VNQTLTFVTGNKDKAKEAQSIIDFPISVEHLSLDEIQDEDIQIVVKRKVQSAFEILHKPVFVDDVGFYIDVWNGFPGPFIKFLLQNNANDLMLYMMRNEANRKVRLVSAIGFCDGVRTEVFIGEKLGTMAKKISGSDGWGLDPLMIPDGYDRTFSELGNETKNKISHRHASLTLLNNFLKDYWK
jgi:XTP/dITP diphosphohydrolase